MLWASGSPVKKKIWSRILRYFYFIIIIVIPQVPNCLYQLWDLIWSHTHGPSLVLEEHKAISALNLWRNASIAKNDQTPIFIAVKSTQKVFNGYGAQETCDMLVEALVYPTMPTASLCSDEDIWTRFKNKVISYQKERVSIALATGSSTMLPYVSSEQPFQFNIKGHNTCLSHVYAYRRSYVKVNQEKLYGLIELPCHLTR